MKWLSLIPTAYALSWTFTEPNELTPVIVMIFAVQLVVLFKEDEK